MNKFRSRKKAAPEGIQVTTDAFAALSTPTAGSPTTQPSPGLQKKKTTRWGRKKPMPEPKPEISFSIALPSTDDFRTSLIMPNLSARFSMLREQDDPYSKLGKASDDSVLLPRRKSRMMDFGHGNLGDIAEVASIRSSIRPPFAQGRQDSYGSEEGYGSENDTNMMNRSRPGEGNNLFGGRQKVYMIPKSGANSTRSLGKAVYNDDIGTSAFQKYKQREREMLEARGSEESQVIHGGFDFGIGQGEGGYREEHGEFTPNDSAKDLTHSPSLSSYDRKRSTTSTSRSEARSSTAATSVASQPAVTASTPSVSTREPVPAKPELQRSNTSKRRLYEQGLDQHMHDQQSSALTRLNSLHRQGTLNRGKQSPALHTTKSTSNLHDRSPQPVYALRAQSPPPLTPLATFGSIKIPRSNTASPLVGTPSSPTSPLLSDFEENTALSQALDPADRGKATAMGAFNKPAQHFDEQQYLERQRALQRSNSNAAIKNVAASKAAMQHRIERYEQQQQQQQQEEALRDRSNSAASTRSRSRSNSRPADPAVAYNVFQKAATQIQTQAGAKPQQQPERAALPDTHRTFFGDIGGSDSEDEDDSSSMQRSYPGPDYGYGTTHGRWQPTVLPAVSEHPALKSEPSKGSLMEEQDRMQPRPLRTAPSKSSLRNQAPTHDEFDSPPLPQSAEGMNDMVHHLRSRSNASSIYPMDDSEVVTADPNQPEIPSMPYVPHNYDNANLPVRSTYGTESRIDSTYSSSNPWDLDESDRGYYGGDNGRYSEVSPVEQSHEFPTFGSRAPSQVAMFQDRQSAVSQYSDDPNAVSWQNELRKQHNRDASNATQQERDAFASELAQRQRAIQEKLAGVVESQSRDTSPAPNAAGTFAPFGILRSKSSGERFSRPEHSAKAMKMLGIGKSTSGRDLNGQYDRAGYNSDAGSPRDNSASRPPMPRGIPREHEAHRDRELLRARGESEGSRGEWQPPSGPTSPPTGAGARATSRARSRSNSAATYGRSRSRTGAYRDDLEKAMMEGTGTSAYGHPDFIPQELTPRPSPDITQEQFQSGRARARSASRTAPGYFDVKNLIPIATAQNGHLTPNGPSPIAYSPSGSTAVSAGGSAYAPHATPPLSGSNTPVNKSFTPPPNSIGQKPIGQKLRKKTISKSDISEPTLISSTSNIDTVDLPEGASLKNGMENAPPIPPFNPKRKGTRKLFGTREPSNDDVPQDHGRSKTPDPWQRAASDRQQPLPFDHAAGSNRDYNGLVAPRSASSAALHSPPLHQQKSYEQHTPATQQYEYGPHSPSPDRIARSPAPPAAQGVGMDGGMF